MPETALITGGTGFVGQALLRRIQMDGRYRLRAVVRSSNTMLPVKVETMQVAGLSSDTDWQAALTGVSVIVHAAAQVHVMQEGVADPLEEYRRVNVAGTLRLAQQAAEVGVRRFVYLSSIKVNGEGTSPGRPFRADDEPAPEDAYAISKQEAERGLLALARESGMEVIIIRPPLVYGEGVKGNFATLLNWVAKGIPLPLGAVRNNRRSLIALDNLVDLIVTCLSHPKAANQVFLASDGEDLSTAELLLRVAKAMGKPARLFPVPVTILELAGRFLRRKEMIRRLCSSLEVDISRTREVLDWVPPVSVEQGLQKTVAPYRFASGT